MAFQEDRQIHKVIHLREIPMGDTGRRHGKNMVTLTLDGRKLVEEDKCITELTVKGVKLMESWIS